MKLPLILVACVLAATNLLAAAALTNADVIQMAQAKIDPNIIITSIQNSDTAFDVSPHGLISLSTSQVPEAVVAAMIKRSNKAEPPAPSSSADTAANSAASSNLMSPSDVYFVDGDKVTTMRYLTPQTRSAPRALGFGGFGIYAVLRGTTANFQTHNAQPSFLVSVPNQAQPESYITLASFAVRKNGTREVLIGGGYISYSTGIHPDRVVAVTSEKAADQSKAQKGFTVYRVTPKAKLASGEYAVVLYSGEMQSLVGSWFAGGGNAYFDFSVQ